MTPEEDSARIIRAIYDRVPLAKCSFCHAENFTLADGFVRLDLSEFRSSVIKIGGVPSLPTVALICQKCGNTMLLNLMILGLGDLLQPPTVPVSDTAPTDDQAG
jgi:hypothetical protein